MKKLLSVFIYYRYSLTPEGKITRIILGEDPTFYDFLDEVLK